MRRGGKEGTEEKREKKGRPAVQRNAGRGVFSGPLRLFRPDGERTGTLLQFRRSLPQDYVPLSFFHPAIFSGLANHDITAITACPLSVHKDFCPVWIPVLYAESAALFTTFRYGMISAMRFCMNSVCAAESPGGWRIRPWRTYGATEPHGLRPERSGCGLPFSPTTGKWNSSSSTFRGHSGRPNDNLPATNPKRRE